MKKLFVLVFFAGIMSSVFAQYPLEQGRLQVNLGTGYTNQGIPAYLGADFGIAENLSLGIDGSYRFFNENFGNTIYKHSIITVLGNVNFHFNKMFKLRDHTSTDLYGGLSGGYAMAESPALYGGSVETGAVFGAQFGYRMFFNEKFGLDLQLNGMSSYIGARIGLTILL